MTLPPRTASGSSISPYPPLSINAVLNGEIMTSVRMGCSQPVIYAELLLQVIGSAASGKRKSVAYALFVDHSPDPTDSLVT
jgi:hypothetical protein